MPGTKERSDFGFVDRKNLFIYPRRLRQYRCVTELATFCRRTPRRHFASWFCLRRRGAKEKEPAASSSAFCSSSSRFWSVWVGMGGERRLLPALSARMQVAFSELLAGFPFVCVLNPSGIMQKRVFLDFFHSGHGNDAFLTCFLISVAIFLIQRISTDRNSRSKLLFFQIGL